MAGTDINMVALSGHLAADMRVAQLSSGTAAGNFTLACNRYIASTTGEAIQRTAFIDCTLYGRAAERLAPFMAKGKEVFVLGRIDQDKWTKDGQNFSRLRIVCEQVKLSGTVKKNYSEQPQSQPQAREPDWQSEGDAALSQNSWADAGPDLEGIPF